MTGAVKMKLFIDDLREPWPGWTLARTITQAIRILELFAVEEVSLDHDIQQTVFGHTEMETFEPVARYLLVMPAPPPVIRFHTGNPTGGKRMAEILGLDYSRTRVEYALYGKETI